LGMAGPPEQGLTRLYPIPWSYIKFTVMEY
jgi:hypothetical protein